MLSSLSIYVRMLDGRDRGKVIEVNREIAIDLVERKQAMAIEDVTSKNALTDWDEKQLAEFREKNTPIRIHKGNTPDDSFAITQVPIAEVNDARIRVNADLETEVPSVRRKRR